jgi:hypothetical protein
MTNWEEYIAGTDRTDSLSYLKVERVPATSFAVLEFRALANRTYSVLYKRSLTDTQWEKLTDVIARPSVRIETVVDPNAVATRFYRLATPAQP